MKANLIRNIFVIFVSANIASVFQWNLYYFGAKYGNYFVPAGIFFLSGILFSFFYLKKTKIKNIAPPAYGVLAISYPLIVHFALPSTQYISLVSIVFVMFSSFFMGSIGLQKELKTSLIVVGLAFCFHFFFAELPPFYLNLVAIALLWMGILLSKNIFPAKWLALVVVVFVGIFAGFKLTQSKYYDLQWKVDQKIERQYVKGGDTYTVTQVKNFKNVYRGNKLLYSTADVYMFYESFVHSAFQLNDEARKILYVGKSKFAVDEILKHKQVTLSTRKDSEDIKGKFDIIFIEDTSTGANSPASYLGFLGDNGLLVVKDSAFLHTAGGLAGAYSKSFHVALPSLYEVTWKVFTRDPSVFRQVQRLPSYIATTWYTSEAYDLVSHRGKGTTGLSLR